MLCAKALALGLKQYFKSFFSKLNQINFFYRYEEGRGGGGEFEGSCRGSLDFQGQQKGIQPSI